MFSRFSPMLFRHWEGHQPVANHELARLLRGYQLDLGHTPGPVLLACVILALAAGLGIGRARHSNSGAARSPVDIRRPRRPSPMVILTRPIVILSGAKDLASHAKALRRAGDILRPRPDPSE